jgi:hypothetical protein
MKASLQAFLAGVEELQGFLTAAEREDALVGLLQQRHASLPAEEGVLLTDLLKTRTNKKRYIYTVAIVALYGLFERFVDGLIARFVNRVAALTPAYDKMPEAIRKHHVQFSVDLVKALIDDRFRTDTTQEEVIGNLHSCLSGTAGFRVNGEAFVLHRGNISLSRVTNFLATVGIDAHLRKAVLTDGFSTYLRQRDPERDFTKIPDPDLDKLFEPIDDLVERRNQVSHGVITVDDIESIDLLKDRCQFVAAYGKALYEIVLQDVLRCEIEGSHAQELGSPIVVYRNSIVCFEHASCKLAVGDVLIAQTGDTLMPYRYSPISSIQINNAPQLEINLSLPTKFGVEVSYKARDTFRYYAVEADRV